MTRTKEKPEPKMPTKTIILLSALMAFNLGGCALLGPKPLTTEQAVAKIDNDLNNLSLAADTYVNKTGFPLPAGGPVNFGGFLLATGLLKVYPTPPLEAKREDWPAKRYRYEHLPQFADLRGPTSAAEAVLWLPGVSEAACHQLNQTRTTLGPLIPTYHNRTDIPDSPIFCIDLGYDADYSIIKIHGYR